MQNQNLELKLRKEQLHKGGPVAPKSKSRKSGRRSRGGQGYAGDGAHYGNQDILRVPNGSGGYTERPLRVTVTNEGYRG